MSRGELAQAAAQALERYRRGRHGKGSTHQRSIGSSWTDSARGPGRCRRWRSIRSNWLGERRQAMPNVGTLDRPRPVYPCGPKPLRQPGWMAEVRVGSVLRAPNGVLRVVRRLRRYQDGRLWVVWFTIRRCSWTGRCYTIYTATDLRGRGYTLPRARRRRLRSAIDRRILAAMRTSDKGHRNGRRPRCCDVEGVA